MNYLVDSPMADVQDYLASLEKRRRHFESDIAGGQTAASPPQFVFYIPVASLNYVRTRTLLKLTLSSHNEMTAISVRLTINPAYIVMFLVGFIFISAAFFSLADMSVFLKKAGIGFLICLAAIVLNASSKQVLLATFERCMSDLGLKRA